MAVMAMKKCPACEGQILAAANICPHCMSNFVVCRIMKLAIAICFMSPVAIWVMSFS